jgi:hypothetical protein
MRKGNHVCSVTAWGLAGLLAAGFPGPVAAAAGAAAAGTEAAGVLEVATEPAGAAVYVDGLMQGATPVSLSLAPGDHRVKVVKEGYLENRRLVSVKTGQSNLVQVKLTPAPKGATRFLQVEEPEGGGGGGATKLILIGLGVLAVGGVIYYFATKNEPPVALLRITPTGAGMAGATSYSFDGSGSSDPDNDTLTYSWNFGDGTSGTGATTTHVYNSAGTFTVTLTVDDGKETATTTGSVTVNRNMAGTWNGTLDFFATTVTFTQSGATLGGTYRDAFGDVGTVSGSISGTNFICPCSVSFAVNIPGFIPFQFRGSVDGGIGRLVGQTFGSGFEGESWTLTR